MIPTHPDRRAMSTPLSHVLSVGITTVLIVALMMGATGFLEEQGERTAREELDTIGNRLAGELDKADTLGRQGDAVTLNTTHTDSVAGSTYTAQLVNGTCADHLEDRTDFPTDTCLVLSTTEFEHVSVVPVDNQTRLQLRETRSGRFSITSSGGSDPTQVPTRSIDLSARVGIGGDVGAPPPIGVGTTLEQRPIARFTFRPGQPQSNTPIEFDASPSADPDGEIDWYEWDFDDDGTFETNVSSPIHSKALDAGWQNVTLRVKDNSSLTGTYSRDVRVSGLEYTTGDMHNVTGSEHGVTFTVTNRHSKEIHIERILIDPTDSSFDEVEEGTSRHELEIDRHDDGSVEGYVEWYGHLDVPEDGAIVDIDDDGSVDGSNVELNPNDHARISVRYFDDEVIGEEFTFGVRYRIGTNKDATVFTDTVTVAP